MPGAVTLAELFARKTPPAADQARSVPTPVPPPVSAAGSRAPDAYDAPYLSWMRPPPLQVPQTLTEMIDLLYPVPHGDPFNNHIREIMDRFMVHKPTS